jgi:molybdopterin converting factor small subunit
VNVARLRLFGPAAQAAGIRIDTVPGTSVDDVLAAARERYGDEFARVARTCVLWVNGETAGAGALVEDGDEIALLPPVSGG